jgi:acetolactate synthase small subunit
VPTTHHLEISVTPGPAVLERIVSACRSRQCSIVSLEFRAGDRHRPGRVSVTFEGADRMAGLAEDRLTRLVEVLAVERPTVRVT